MLFTKVWLVHDLVKASTQISKTVFLISYWGINNSESSKIAFQNYLKRILKNVFIPIKKSKTPMIGLTIFVYFSWSIWLRKIGDMIAPIMPTKKFLLKLQLRKSTRLLQRVLFIWITPLAKSQPSFANSTRLNVVFNAPRSLDRGVLLFRSNLHFIHWLLPFLRI